MLREYPEPKDFESFLYVSQVLQAEGIRTGAEHLRRIMPRNMGSLYWQLDDCWPVASWSSIDYYGRWKALQYFARHFYNDLLISPHLEEGHLKFYVVSDRTKPVPATIHILVMDFEGKVSQSLDREVTIAPTSSQAYYDLALSDALKGARTKSSFLYCELLVGGKVVSTHDYFFAPFKELQLPRPKLSYEVAPAKDGFRVTIKSNKFAKAVYLSAGDLAGSFSDNYFDLIPGKPVTVEYRSPAGLSLKATPGVAMVDWQPRSVAFFRERLVIRSMVDAF
jgi:beta-mannosidase